MGLKPRSFERLLKAQKKSRPLDKLMNTRPKAKQKRCPKCSITWMTASAQCPRCLVKLVEV